MLHVRSATPADAMAIAEVHVRAWQVGYQGLVPQTFLDKLSEAEFAGRYRFTADPPNFSHTLIAVDGDAVCGHVTVGTSSDPNLPDWGELRSLYVDPPRWGKGVAQALHAAGRDKLIQAGHRRAFAWILITNSRSRRFHESVDWRADGVERIETHAGHPFHQVRYVTTLSC
jgi:predicted N-acetyltransferase YhbS